MTRIAPLDLFGPPPHPHPDVHADPRAESLPGCRMCGLLAAQHGPTLIHRFLPPRPITPAGTDGRWAA